MGDEELEEEAECGCQTYFVCMYVRVCVCENNVLLDRNGSVRNDVMCVKPKRKRCL